MGNGATVTSHHGSDAQQLIARREQFREIEKLCRNDHFREHFQDYCKYFNRAIKNDALDVIELLLPAGNAKKIQPLHIACKHAKIEAAELLLSAGFSLYLKDERGRVALHLCSLKSTQEAGLCTTLLALQGGKKLINSVDNLGQSVLHLAAQHDNFHVIQALINIGGINSRLKNHRGLTPLDVAHENESHKVVQLLETYASAVKKKKSNVHGGGGGSDGELLQMRSIEASQVDMERIMQVWERFFENAFSMNGIEVNDAIQSNDHLPIAYDDIDRKKLFNIPSTEAEYGYNPSPQSHDKKFKKKKRDSAEYSEDKRSWYRNETNEDRIVCADDVDRDYFDRVETSSKELSHCKDMIMRSNEVLTTTEEKPYYTLDYDAANEVIAWLDWVVCYDYSFVDNGDAYYVVNKYTKEWKWLTTHINDFCNSTLFPTTKWDDYDYNMSLPYPTTLFDLVCRGWLTYYDISTNSSEWFNVPTYSMERSLPLGIGEDHETLVAFHLRRHGSSVITGHERNNELDEQFEFWYETDSICSISWILVISYRQDYSEKDIEGKELTISEAKQSFDDSQSKEDKSSDNCFKATHQQRRDIASSNDVDDSWVSSKTERLASTSEKIRSSDDLYLMDKEEEAKTGHADESTAAEVSYYYMHRITLESSWEAPYGWDDLVNSWGGWTLCCDEDYLNQPYWHDFDTGDSIWAES